MKKLLIAVLVLVSAPVFGAGNVSSGLTIDFANSTWTGITRAEEIFATNFFGNGSGLTNVSVDSKGNIRIGTNSGSTATMPNAVNGMLIGSYGPGSWVTGNGIAIGGGNGGGADHESLAFGIGAGAADGSGGTNAGAIAIGNQTDAFGLKSITIGYGDAGVFSDYTIVIGTGNGNLIADNSVTNCIYLGNNMGGIGANNATVIGNAGSSTALIFGKITGNGSGLTNLNVSISFMPTNALSTWPTVPQTGGGAALVNSNGTIFLLTSLPKTLTWGATNKLAP